MTTPLLFFLVRTHETVFQVVLGSSASSRNVRENGRAPAFSTVWKKRAGNVFLPPFIPNVSDGTCEKTRSGARGWSSVGVCNFFKKICVNLAPFLQGGNDREVRGVAEWPWTFLTFWSYPNECTEFVAVFFLKIFKINKVKIWKEE